VRDDINERKDPVVKLDFPSALGMANLACHRPRATI
jgi:hypothetical protein